MKSRILLLYCFTILFEVIQAENTDLSSIINFDSFDFNSIFDKLNLKVPENTYNEDMHLNFSQIVKKYGYPVEEYEVKSSDGYLLTMFRIPGKGPAVLVASGSVLSSDDYVTIGPQAGLAYQLADAGYDVWLGNCRGTRYSLRHATLSPDSAAYWDFSLDELGRYDMPALIDYVLCSTNTKDVKVLTYSSSTSLALIMCSEKPEYNKKISLLYLLSPSMFLAHTKAYQIRMLAGPLTPDIHLLAKSFGLYSGLSKYDFGPLVDVLKNIFCSTPETAYAYCHTMLFLSFGPDYSQVNMTSLPVIYGHFPGSGSIKSMQHITQWARSGKFTQYDLGKALNVKTYGSIDPPEYPLNKVTTKVAIAWASNDWMCVKEDLQTLLDKLPNVIDLYKVPSEEFCHTDYIFAKDVKTLLYDKILEMLKQN